MSKNGGRKLVFRAFDRLGDLLVHFDEENSNE